VAAKIKEIVPEAIVVINRAPKEWVDFEIYCQLIPNEDEKDPYYGIVPRTGAFEVSFKGVVSFLKDVIIFLANFLKNDVWHVAKLW
jgi:hypothetical protein